MGLLMHKGKSYGGGLTRLLDMLDVNISNPSNGDLIQYNSTNQKYENSADVWDTMAQNGAHNLLKYPYYATTQVLNGITFTINSDGSVTVSGTASANATLKLHEISLTTNNCIISNGSYKASGCPANGSASTYKLDFHYRASNGNDTLLAHDYGEGGEFTVNGGYYSNDYILLGVDIIVYSGTVISTPITFKPMIRLASDPNTDYTPYAPTNHDLAYVRDGWKNNGAYNLCPNNATTQVVKGITCTVNSDGTVTLGTGTVAATGSLVLGYVDFGDTDANTTNGKTLLNGGKYLMLDGTNNSTTTTYSLFYQANVKALYIRLYGGTVISSPVTIKPMITTDLNATADDYVPYAKTNRELTEDLGFGAVGASLVDTYVDTSAGSSIALRKWGHICLLNMQIKTTSSLALNTQQTIATIPSGYIPKYGMFDTTFDKGYDHTNENHDIEIDTNGTIKLTLRNTHNNARWVCATMTYICE